jgi:hypothetical protein
MAAKSARTKGGASAKTGAPSSSFPDVFDVDNIEINFNIEPGRYTLGELMATQGKAKTLKATKPKGKTLEEITTLADELTEFHNQSGKRYDAGKLRYDLIPPECLEALAFVYTIGAEKYGDWNWSKGLPFGKTLAAMERHIQAWRKGETFDQEDGQHHLGSVAWGAFALMWMEIHRPEFDDRKLAMGEQDAD